MGTLFRTKRLHEATSVASCLLTLLCCKQLAGFRTRGFSKTQSRRQAQNCSLAAGHSMADAHIHQHVKYITPLLNHRPNTGRGSWTLGSPKPPGVAVMTSLWVSVLVEHKGTQKGYLHSWRKAIIKDIAELESTNPRVLCRQYRKQRGLQLKPFVSGLEHLWTFSVHLL